MFEYLSGQITRRSPTEVVIDCHGVGYLVRVSLTTYADLPDKGSARLLVHPHYAESTQRLYGFSTAAERSLFRLLQGVRGVGPTLAVNMLSHEPPRKLLARLHSGDVSALTRVKGIGKKTAERILVELKDRLPEIESAAVANPTLESVLVSALVHLGVSGAEAEQRARRTLERRPEESQVDVLLREALQAGG